MHQNMTAVFCHDLNSNIGLAQGVTLAPVHSTTVGNFLSGQVETKPTHPLS